METKMPERWITGSPQHRKPDGPSSDISQLWIDAGRPHDFKAFRLGFDCCSARMLAAGGGVAMADVVAELQKAHRIIYLQRMQMSTQGKVLYARNAHHAGLIGGDETREAERGAVLARAGVLS
jgi:hypothetical protein